MTNPEDIADSQDPSIHTERPPLAHETVQRMVDLIEDRSEASAIASPYSPVIRGLYHLSNNGNQLRDAVPGELKEGEDRSSLVAAFKAGRVKPPFGEADSLMAPVESDYLGYVMTRIERRYLRKELEAPETFADISAKDYGGLVQEIAASEALLITEPPRFGEKKHDLEVVGFLDTINSLVILAQASDNPRVAANAKQSLAAMAATIRSNQEREIATRPPVEMALADVQNPHAIGLAKIIRNTSLALDVIKHGEDCIDEVFTRTPGDGGKQHRVAQAVRERLEVQQKIHDIYDEEVRLAEAETPIEPSPEVVTQATLEALINELPVDERLDFVPFEDDELDVRAQEVIDEANARLPRSIGKSLRIDPERITHLKTLQRAWEQQYGVGAAKFMRAELKGRRSTSVDGRIFFDEYIFLDLKKPSTETGQMEDCGVVADSPVAGQNAAFIFRNDTESSKGYSWQDVFKLRKLQTRVFGTRAIKHMDKNGGDPNIRARDKLFNLLFVPPEHFGYLDHDRVEREATRGMGAGYVALKGAMEHNTED